MVLLLLLLLLLSKESLQYLSKTRWLSDAMLANSMPTDYGLSCWTVTGEFSVEMLIEEPLPEGSLLGGPLFWGLLLKGSQLFGGLLLGGSLSGFTGGSPVLWHVLIFRIAPVRSETDKSHQRGKRSDLQVHAMQKIYFLQQSYVGQNRYSPFFFPLVLLAPFPFGGTFSFCVDPKR